MVWTFWIAGRQDWVLKAPFCSIESNQYRVECLQSRRTKLRKLRLDILFAHLRRSADGIFERRRSVGHLQTNKKTLSLPNIEPRLPVESTVKMRLLCRRSRCQFRPALGWQFRWFPLHRQTLQAYRPMFHWLYKWMRQRESYVLAVRHKNSGTPGEPVPGQSATYSFRRSCPFSCSPLGSVSCRRRSVRVAWFCSFRPWSWTWWPWLRSTQCSRPSPCSGCQRWRFCCWPRTCDSSVCAIGPVAWRAACNRLCCPLWRSSWYRPPEMPRN